MPPTSSKIWARGSRSSDESENETSALFEASAKSLTPLATKASSDVSQVVTNPETAITVSPLTLSLVRDVTIILTSGAPTKISETMSEPLATCSKLSKTSSWLLLARYANN